MSAVHKTRLAGSTSASKVAARLADALKADIIGGRREAGETLPSERDLAVQYSVNRSSVREALLRLEAWGLVEIRHGGGTRVRDFLVSAGFEVLPHLLQLGAAVVPGIMGDLHDIRGMILGWCAASAARLADPASVDRLARLARQMRRAGARPAELQELDYAFFEQLVGISGNRVLIVFANAVREVYMRERQSFLPIYRKGVFDARLHERAVCAIRAREPEVAAAAMRAHAATALCTCGPSA